MWNTVLFDLDGTLTDSGEGITKCVQYALNKEFGIEIRDLHQLDCFVGPPLKEQFMRFASLSDAEGDRAVAAYRERYSAVGIYENRLYGGIQDLLETLAKEHFTLAVSSSKPTVFCREVLRFFGIEHYFTSVVGSGMDGSRVEKDEVLSETLRQLGMENMRDEVVLVGDRNYDVIGAKKAGIASIGVTYGYGSRQELEAAWPDCIVDSTTELRNVLLGQAHPENILPPAGYGFHPVRPAAPYEGNALFKIWRVFYPMLLYFAVSMAASLVVSAVLILIGIFMKGSASFNYEDIYNSIMGSVLLMTGVADAVCAVLFYFFYRSDERRRTVYYPEKRVLRKNQFSAFSVFGIICLTIGASVLVNTLISSLNIQDPAFESSQKSMMENTGFLQQFIVIGIVAPACEELFFRGLIYRRLRDYLGVTWAIVISGAVFGIFHGNITQGIFAFLLGMLFALIYEHFGTIWASLTAHMANNLYALIMDDLLGNSIPDSAAYIMLGLCTALMFFFAWYFFWNEKRVNRF